MTDENDNWYGAHAATFGDRLTGAREAAGLTQEDLARKLGVKLKTVQSWEDDLLDPRANKLAMLAGMLNVSMRWLLTGEGDGLDAPAGESEIPVDGKKALAELGRMRVQMLSLSKDMGYLEKRLRGLMKEAVE